MKFEIKVLGVIDVNGGIHPVYLKPGLNIITGKSSTGKSAVIEIFDYCLASTDHTIPKGIITKVAKTFYVAAELDTKIIIFARKQQDHKRGFYKEEDISAFDCKGIGDEYFDEAHFIPIDNYKEILERQFFDFTTVDEVKVGKDQQQKKHKPTPTIRSFTSFMLQHQNLIANKHAIFYRFDDHHKRQQVIDHAKIFLGIVDQNYFLLKQEKEILEEEIKRVSLEIDRTRRAVELQKAKVQPLLDAVFLVAGISKPAITASEILLHPALAKRKLDVLLTADNIDPLSDELSQKRIKLEEELSQNIAEHRILFNKISSIERSIDNSRLLDKSSREDKPYSSENISISVCPFCKSHSDELEQSAKKLSGAIQQLAHNLIYAKESISQFQKIKLEAKEELRKVDDNIQLLRGKISEIDKSSEELRNRKTIYEQVVESKAKLFFVLDTLAEPISSDQSELLIKSKERLKPINDELDRYNVESQVLVASNYVSDTMNSIANTLNFEEDYLPAKFRFSFSDFSLCFAPDSEDPIYLRSMGSGANWLYSHISLFLALHKIFAKGGKKCAIPSALFLDQPTQVYFPSFSMDQSDHFSIEQIKQIEQRPVTARPVDDDLACVENLFSVLDKFCNETFDETGIMPQIIVTDHADNLHIHPTKSFDSFVNGNRWRDRGLIHPIPNIPNDSKVNNEESPA